MFEFVCSMVTCTTGPVQMSICDSIIYILHRFRIVDIEMASLHDLFHGFPSFLETPGNDIKEHVDSEKIYPGPVLLIGA